MKKILIAAGVIILLLIAALLILPSVFKPQIVAQVKALANDNLNATLDFDDVDISFFSSFPQVDVVVNGLTVANRAPFEGDTLATVNSLIVSVSWSSLWNSIDEIDEIAIVQPRLLLKANADGDVNWDVAVNSGEEVAQNEATTPISLAINSYLIDNADIQYHSETDDQELIISQLTHRGSGNFADEQFLLNTETEIGSITYSLQGNRYLNQAEFAAAVQADIDLKQKRYTLKENSLRLNQLQLKFDGWLAEVEEGLQLNFTFDAPTVSLNQVLSLVPQIYRNDFENLSADGKVRTAGFIKGKLSENHIPSFDVNLSVADGRFSYRQQGSMPVSDIQLSLNVKNPGNTPDETLVNLRNLHFELLERPFDAQFFAKTPVSDLFVSGSVKGSLDLAAAAKALALPDSLQLNGQLQTDLEINGYPSAIEKKQPKRFTARGDLLLKELKYAAADFPDPLHIRSAKLQLTPATAVLESFSAATGQTNLSAQGQLDNIVGYAFGGDNLSGALHLEGDLVDLNPFIEGESEELVAIELPGRIEFLLTTKFGKVLMDNLEMKNVRGDMLLKDQKLTLDDLHMDLLRGHVIVNGSYTYLPPARPQMFFDLDVARVNIPDLFASMLTVQKVAPIAAFMTGDLNGKINLNSELDETLTPVWSQLFSKGGLDIPKVSIKGFEPLTRASKLLNLSALHNPAINNFGPSYEVKNGRFFLKPTQFKIGQYNVVASGSNGFDKSLDYQLELQIPARELKNTANDQISSLLKTDVKLLTNETINVTLNFGGQIDNPSVKAQKANVLTSATDPLKIAAQQEAEKQKKAAEAAAAAELEKKKAEAQAALDKQKAELEKKKKEAKDKLKNKLKGLFDDN